MLHKNSYFNHIIYPFTSYLRKKLKKKKAKLFSFKKSVREKNTHRMDHLEFLIHKQLK